jgi:hypothetical protein
MAELAPPWSGAVEQREGAVGIICYGRAVDDILTTVLDALFSYAA